MANLYCCCKGRRGEIHRLGNRFAVAEARGWEIGGAVRATVTDAGKVRIEFFLTGGSNHRRGDIEIGSAEIDQGLVKFAAGPELTQALLRSKGDYDALPL